MLLACVIDGGVSHHELGLLSRTRKTIQRPDAWPPAMSAEDKTLHEDVLDTLIEERSQAWARVIRDGGHSFVRRNYTFNLTCLTPVDDFIVFDAIPQSFCAAGNPRQRSPA
eukprot:COSAG02_NODE_1368_length_13029_cov_83.912142_2_plen_111_part_00